MTMNAAYSMPIKANQKTLWPSQLWNIWTCRYWVRRNKQTSIYFIFFHVKSIEYSIVLNRKIHLISPDCNILYKELPSKLASACIAAARHSHNLNFWTNELEELTTYSQKDVETCMLNLLTFKIDLQTGGELSDVDNNLVIADQNHARQNSETL